MSICDRAREAERQWKERMAAEGIKDNGLSLYRTFYRNASSMHHMHIGGVFAGMDENMNEHITPSWAHVDDALVPARSVLSCVSLYDDMAGLGMQERIQFKTVRIKLTFRLAKRFERRPFPLIPTATVRARGG